MQDLQWFDRYSQKQHGVVCFEDFRKDNCRFNWFLRLIDKYEVMVPIKGGSKKFNPAVICITCPRLPQEEFTFRDKYDNGAIHVNEDIE